MCPSIVAQLLYVFDIFNWGDYGACADWLIPNLNQVWIFNFRGVVNLHFFFFVHVLGQVCDRRLGDDRHDVVLLDQTLSKHVQVQHPKEPKSKP